MKPKIPHIEPTLCPVSLSMSRCLMKMEMMMIRRNFEKTKRRGRRQVAPSAQVSSLMRLNRLMKGGNSQFGMRALPTNELQQTSFFILYSR